MNSGVVAYAFSVLLGITSLPSVTAALSWKEFAFIQSKLGWACLVFAVMHDLFYGWPYMSSLSCYVPPTFQVEAIILMYYLTNLYSNIAHGKSLFFHSILFFSMLSIFLV